MMIGDVSTLDKGDEPETQGVVASSSNVFRRLRPVPAYKVVSEELERLIVSGRLKPGDPLPTEQELSESFGVNRSTVREAIRQIEQEGMLERREGRRLFVCLPGLFDLAPRATRMLMLQQTTFEELWETAVTLEPLAARLAAANANAEDLARLQANINATAALTLPGEQPDSELAELVDLDVEFHALVGAASHNRPLMLAREPISLLYKPTLRRIYARIPQSKSRALAAHRRIVEGLANADAQLAVDWTQKHMVDFHRGFQMADLDMKAPIRLFLRP
ncbi:FadR/GntR family transcriptional regulator [Comamonas sp. C11]|uniref:FadR/GntR family transcriptional regulator n=1 Tax=Comamonas sp. C11 TaxID=2966554 RepID=UPI0021131981|nr:GntR family transcriptional regulator [Comamonas sp. C11]UUC91491.1 GntR family transcriptional regulator [Comamonas sp. C11]